MGSSEPYVLERLLWSNAFLLHTPSSLQTPSPLQASPRRESGRPDSNRRRSAWKADALPTELLPRECFGRAALRPPTFLVFNLARGGMGGRSCGLDRSFEVEGD